MEDAAVNLNPSHRRHTTTTMTLFLIQSSFSSVVLTTAFVIGIILLHPSLPPPFKYEPYELSLSPLEGPLKLNGKLNNAEQLFHGQIKGPEHLVVHKGQLYTSVHGGHIVKISENSIEPIVKFGQDCIGFSEEEKCGRPLGFHIDENDTLYVADAYYGIKQFNLKTGAVATLVDINTEIEGIAPQIPNSVAVARDGKVYWTDSATSHNLQDLLYTLLGDPTGRLIVYDPVTKTNQVLMKNIHFANGVALAPDESFVIVAETARAKILRHHLKGPKKGTSDIFIDRLPGLPDNIHHDGQGTYWVAIVDSGGAMGMSTKYSLLRKFISRSLALIQNAIQKVDSFYPHRWFKRAYHIVGHYEMIQPLGVFLKKKVTIVYFDKNGQIIKTLHATDGKVGSVSSMIEHRGYYYLGSPTNEYLARVKK